jgi:hypothetical protein
LRDGSEQAEYDADLAKFEEEKREENDAKAESESQAVGKKGSKRKAAAAGATLSAGSLELIQTFHSFCFWTFGSR